MNFESLFSLSYYIEPSPAGDFLYGYALLAFFILVLFLKKVFIVLGPKNKYFKKSLKKKFWKFLPLGGLGVLFVLSRFAQVPYISMRLWLYLCFIITFVWFIWTTFTIIKLYKMRIDSVKREKH